MRLKLTIRHSRGFTLIITLVMVALAAILVIGLLVSASSDRLTAVSYDQRLQAELAAQSGLEAAKQALYAIPSPTPTPSAVPLALKSRTQNDDFIVVASPDPNGTSCPYYFIGCAEDPTIIGNTDYLNPAIRYYPLFSGGTMSAAVTPTPSPGIFPAPPPPPAPASVASQTFGSTIQYYPKLFPTPAPHANWQSSIRTQWQYVPLPSPVPSPSPMEYRYT